MNVAPVFGVDFAKDVLDQQWDVFLAITQRRQVNAKTFIEAQRSCRSSPLATAWSGSLLVAARTRTSTGVYNLLPRLRTL